MKVGFIGLGIMGKPMAKNLIKANYELTIYARNINTVDEFRKLGVNIADNCKEVAEQSEAIILMLPNSPDVEDVLSGQKGLMEGLSAGKVVIDMSSINPAESQRFAELVSVKGTEWLDAPVSGGEPKAIDGTISVMVGGKEAVFNKYYDLIKSMAADVVRVGDLGAGNTAKLCNQIIVALNIAAVSEAFVLAKKAGVDPAVVYKAIRGGLAGSAVMDAKGPMMLEGNFKPGFRLDLHIKDLQNALDISHLAEVSLPLTASIMEIMQSLRTYHLQKYDHSAIIKYYEKMNNITIGNNLD